MIKLLLLFGVLLFMSCSTDNHKIADQKTTESKNSLELKLNSSQMNGEGLTGSLEELYSILFVEIDSKLKENKEIIEVEFVVVLDRNSKMLYIEDIKYYTKDDLADVFALAYMESKNKNYSTRDVDATCLGGKLDGQKAKFSEDLRGMRKLAKWSKYV